MTNAGEPAPVLDVRDVHIAYPAPRNLLGRRPAPVSVVHGVDVTIGPCETVGLVGESGSGKSTLGRSVLGLLPPTSGSITVVGHHVERFDGRIPKSFRRAIQVVFQDPVASLNPALTVGQLLDEPLRIHSTRDSKARRQRVGELLELVGMAASAAGRRPFEFSGGQRQRIAIARALAPEPSVIVLDEPVSALDVSTQSQVINLLEDLQRDQEVGYLFIAHDLAVVRHISHRIAVMYRGRIVEVGPADDVCDSPLHPYTQLLLASALVPNVTEQRERRRQRRSLLDDRPETQAEDRDAACPFVDRCVHAQDVCRTVAPRLEPVSVGRESACHLTDASVGPLPALRPPTTN